MLGLSPHVLAQAAPTAISILAGAIASVTVVRSLYLGIVVCAVLRTRDTGQRQVYYQMFRDLLGQPAIRGQK